MLSLTAEILEECGRKGVKTAIIGSAGFSEAGPEGQERQDEFSAIAKRYDIRVCGPNCHGTFNVYKNIPCGYDHSFALPIKPGPVAIASHSGALFGVIGHRAVQANQGFSYMVSNGNEMDFGSLRLHRIFSRRRKHPSRRRADGRTQERPALSRTGRARP